MRQFLRLLSGAALFISLAGDLVAQDTTTAGARSDRQYYEERYNSLNSAVDDLAKANVALQKRLANLADEVERLRAENARLNTHTANYATQEDLQRLARKIQELDENRKKDRELILEEIRHLLKTAPPPARTSPARPEKTKDNDESKETKVEKGYKYKVQPGDRLSVIVNEYRKNGVKVTMQQVIKANPGVIKNPNRLPVGSTIFIPDNAP